MIILFRIETWLKQHGYILISVILGLILGLGVPAIIHHQEKVTESNYQNIMSIATSFVSNEQYEDALDVLANIRFRYEPAKVYYNEISDLCDLNDHYSDGIAYMEQGYYVYAIHEFARCISYKDASDLIDPCIMLAIEEV